MTANPVVQQGITPGGCRLGSHHRSRWQLVPADVAVAHARRDALRARPARPPCDERRPARALGGAALRSAAARLGKRVAIGSGGGALRVASAPRRVGGVDRGAQGRALGGAGAALDAGVGASHDARRSTRSYVASLGWFALGLLAKPMLVTLPFLLVVLEVWPLRRISTCAGQGRAAEGDARSLVRKHAVPGAVDARERRDARGPAGGGDVTRDAAASRRGPRTRSCPSSCICASSSWPVDLAAIYPHPSVDSHGRSWIAALGLLAALTAIAVSASASGSRAARRLVLVPRLRSFR